MKNTEGGDRESARIYRTYRGGSGSGHSCEARTGSNRNRVSRVRSATRGAAVGHVSPEAAAGGVIALIKDGDIIDVDITNRQLNLHVDEAELAKRRATWKAPHQELTGYIKRYAKLVTSGSRGAVFEK